MVFSKRSRLFVVVAVLISPVGAFATDGYFASGQGVACKAMAGACVALPLDTIAPATNPAANAFLGSRYDIALELFSPRRDYTVTGNPSGAPGTFGLAPGKVKSGSTSFLIPSLGANWKLSDRASAGVAIYGNGGMNTDYEARTYGFQPTGVDLMQLFVAPTFAWKITPDQAIGVTGILAYQRIRLEGLQAFALFSSDATKVTNNGYDSSTGGGLRVGYLGNFGVTSLGASYQTKTSMSEFDEYAGLLAGRGDFDIPANWRVGLAIKPSDSYALTLDYGRILYSSGSRAVANPLLPNLVTARLGDPDGGGFGWRDISTWKLGFAYSTSPSLTFRGGYSSGDQPIQSADVLPNIIAPGVIKKHVAAGVTLKGSREWNFTVVRALSQSVTGPNALEAPGQQSIKLRMDQWELAIGVGFGK